MNLKTKKKLIVETDCIEKVIVEILTASGPMSHGSLWDALWKWAKGSDISYFRVALNNLQIDGTIDRVEGKDDRPLWSIK